MARGSVFKNHTLTEYQKEYKNRKKLLSYTKEEVRSYDLSHGHYHYEYSKHDYVYDDYLLHDRLWWLIDNTYYEVPKKPSYAWFRNLHAGVQIGTCILGVGIIAGSVTAAIVLNLPKPGPQPGPTPIDPDVTYVTELNNLIAKETNIKTLFDAVEFIKTSKGINLEEQKTQDQNKEYAFDTENREFVLLNKDGSVAYTAKEFKYKSSVFKFSDNYVLDKSISDPSNVYGTYIKEKTINKNINNLNAKNVFKFANDDKDELIFNTSLDVGYNKQYKLKFEKAETSNDFKPVVVTNRNDLDIKGSVTDIHHYGVATSLSVDSFEGTYNEHGSVDGEVVVKSKAKLVVEPEAKINSIIVEIDGVKINAKEDSYVGTVAKTNNVTETVEDITSESADQTIVKKKEEAIPETRDFNGGFGTKESPFSISTSASLNDLSSKVNNETTAASYADKYYRITKNIDLSDTPNFTPIGNSTYKFKGYVDGCNSTISNINCKQTTANCGLFGVIEGTENLNFENKTHVWKDNAFYEDNITEDKYTCVVKNLNIANSNFEIEASAKKKQVGALAGTAFAVRIENVHFLSGTVKGYKAVGGFAGDLSCCAMINCSTGSDVTVTSDVYHVGGISGYTQSRIGDCSSGQAIVNTTNNAKIICLNNESPGVGGAGGLCGYTNGGDTDKSLSIIGCVNNGIVTTNPDGGAKRPQYIAGIVGYGHQGLELIANTTNNGQVINNAAETVDDMAGICSLGRGEFVNCINNGDLIGKAKFKSGIIAGEANSSHFTQEVKNCVNNGKIIADGGRASTIAADMQDLKMSNVEFATTNELFDGLTSSIYKTHICEFNNVKVNNPGTYNIATEVSHLTIKSDTKLFETFTNPSNIVSLDIEAPMGDVTLSNAPNAYITINSKNTVVTVAEGATISHLTIKGEGSSVINNGTITNGIDLNGLSTKCTNNGTIGGLNIDNFEGTVTKEFINNGLVSSSQRHCMSITSSTGTCNLTIHNYGTIRCTSTENAHYLLLQYSEGHFDMYNYAGSAIDCNGLMNGAHPGSHSGTGVFYHQTQDLGGKNPAIFTSEKFGDDWNNLAWGGVYTVQEF